MAPTRSGGDYLKPERGESPTSDELSDLTPLDLQMAASVPLPASDDDGVPSGTSEQSERASVARDVSDVSPVPTQSYASVVVDDRSEGLGSSDAGPAHVGDVSQHGVEVPMVDVGSNARPKKDRGFTRPRVTARKDSVRSSSPIDAKPKFFPEWFEDSGNESEDGKDNEDDAVSWYDLPEDGIGELPDWVSARSKDIKKEEVTPRLTPIDDVMNQVYGHADTPTRETLKARAQSSARYAKPPGGPGDSDPDSDSTSDSGYSSHSSSHKGRRSRKSSKRSSRKSANSKRSRYTDPAFMLASEYTNSTTAAMADRIHASKKGKSVDPAEYSGKAPVTPVHFDTDSESDHDQIKADYLAALELQGRLDKEARATQTLHDDFLRREAEFIKEREARILREAELRSRIDYLQRKAAKKVRQRETKARERAEKLSQPEEPKRKETTDKPREKRSNSPQERKQRAKKGESEEREKNQRYRKASSKLPRSSRLKRAMGSDGSDSSSSDSESSDKKNTSHWRLPEIPSSEESESDYFPMEPDSVHSSDSEPTKSAKRRAKRRYKDSIARLKFQQGFLKADPPFIYAAEVKADVFNKWTREVRTFVKLGLLTHKQAIMMMGKYLSGKAYDWFDREILNAKKKIKWTLNKFFTALFDEIFPADFRARQRDLFDACEQGSRKTKDFMQRLQNLANTIGNISDEDIVLAFWRRCNSYLRVEFTRQGYEAETISLKRLMQIAEREERVYLLMEEERKRELKKSGDKDTGKKQQNSQNKEKTSGSSKPDFKTEKSSGDKKNKEQKKKEYQDSKDQKDQKSKEARDRKKRLREKGLCFNCEGEHLAKDCPEGQKVPAPAARAVRIDFAEIERLKAVKLASKLGLMAMYPVDPYKTDEWQEACDAVLVAKAITDLRAAVPFMLDNVDDSDPENPPYDHERFVMYSTTEDEFAIIDHHQGLDYTVPKHLLREEDFDLVDWVKWQMAENYDPRRTRTRVHSASTEVSVSESDLPSSDAESDSWSMSDFDLSSETTDSCMPYLQSVSDSESDAEGVSEFESETDSEGSNGSADSMPGLQAVSATASELSEDESAMSTESSLEFTDSGGLDWDRDLWSNVFDYCAERAAGAEESPRMEAIARETLGWAGDIVSLGGKVYLAEKYFLHALKIA
ncbi:hypothetical protein C8R43DRAFT_953081 [Mycena crocata]|nr:hypothetical protein C8R43DRAFT_953081 [Mycena crocata]